MQALSATGKVKMNKLSPQQVAELKAQVDEAVTKTSRDRSTKKKGKADSAASDPKNAEPVATRPRAPRGFFARKASQALLDSLATPAPPAKAAARKSKPGCKQVKVSKAKQTKAKAKAESRKAAREGSKPKKSKGNTEKAGYICNLRTHIRQCKLKPTL